MSFYFHDRPKFGDRLRGKSGDELLQEIKQQFDEDSKSFFEPANRSGRDPFERQSTFSRGFPFDDDGFGRRNDIRSHLDDLAARHPEFADHLVGPPWGDVPLRSSFYNRSRDPGKSGRNNCQAYSDEDARSQASGSSAASGASAASSHSETENAGNQQDKFPNHEKTNRRSQIPQYGLRNTVDIGQHHHNMENADRGNRGQRSMSAPPENMQPSNQQPHHQQQEQPNQQSQPHGQGYATWRRPINTPQQGQPQQPQQQPQPQQQRAQQQPQFSSQQKPQSQQQFPSQQKPQPQSNVRHIPIFVEGRDEPVLPRSFDEPSNFRREPSPTQFNRAYYQTRSPFGTHYARQPQQQQQQRDEQQRQQKPQYQQQQYSPQQQQQYPPQQQQQYPQQQQQQYHHQQQQYPQPQPQPQQQPQQQQQPHPQQDQQHSQQPQQQPEPPKPKPIVPKDPLERVALVQKEVDSLAEQVARYTGNSRTAKDYMYLDEMLTRELIKLDDIETEGRDNVRQARKNAIRTIQETISLLESKAPLPSQQVTAEEQQRKQEDEVSSNVEQPGQTVPMDADQKAEEDRSHKEAIPLPPCPSSPTKQPEECKQATGQNSEKSDSNRMANIQQEPSEAACEPLEAIVTAGKQEVTGEQQYPEQIDPPVEKEQGNNVEENQQATAENKAENGPTEEEKPEGVIAEEVKTENVSTEQKTENTSKKKKKKGAASEEKKNAGENICKETQSG